LHQQRSMWAPPASPSPIPDPCPAPARRCCLPVASPVAVAARPARLGRHRRPSRGRFPGRTRRTTDAARPVAGSLAHGTGTGGSVARPAGQPRSGSRRARSGWATHRPKPQQRAGWWRGGGPPDDQATDRDTAGAASDRWWVGPGGSLKGPAGLGPGDKLGPAHRLPVARVPAGYSPVPPPCTTPPPLLGFFYKARRAELNAPVATALAQSKPQPAAARLGPRAPLTSRLPRRLGLRSRKPAVPSSSGSTGKP